MKLYRIPHLETWINPALVQTVQVVPSGNEFAVTVALSSGHLFLDGGYTSEESAGYARDRIANDINEILNPQT